MLKVPKRGLKPSTNSLNLIISCSIVQIYELDLEDFYGGCRVIKDSRDEEIFYCLFMYA